MHIVCHPENFLLIRDQFQHRYTVMTKDGPVVNFKGIEVVSNPHIQRYAKKWNFPQAAFVEYDKSDEEWARPLGFGYESDDIESPIYFVIKD